MVKKANQDGPRRSKRQMGLDVTPTVGKTLTKGQKKAGKVVAQGRLGKLAKEKASHKRQLPSSAQVRMPEKLHNEEPGDDLDEHTDAWRYVEDPEDVIENEDAEHNDQDIEEEDEEAEAEEEKEKEKENIEEAEKEKEKEKENTKEAEKEKEIEKENTEEEEEDSSAEEGGKEHEECLTDQSKTKKRRNRGPTKMNKVAKRHEEKVEVQFTSFGEPVDLGPNAAKVKIEKVINRDAYLWRPSEHMNVIGDALFKTIAWPISKVILCEVAGPSKGSSPKVQSVAKGAVPSKYSSSRDSSPKSGTNSTNTRGSPKKNCFLLDCFGSGQTVAEGKVLSNNPEDKVHFVPLGPNASKVWIEVCKVDDARVWRPNSEFQIVADALGSTVAWPNDKIVFM
ncbi:hypothetical protein Bca4012_063738 [Brassica carinata]